MKIQFLQDTVIIGMPEFKKDEIVYLNKVLARDLIARGQAKEVVESKSKKN